MISSVLTYGILWIMLRAFGNSDQINESDLPTFTYIALIVLAIGVITAILHHVMINMPKAEADAQKVHDKWTSEQAAAKTTKPKQGQPQASAVPRVVPVTTHTPTWKDHLKDEMFYRVGLLYIAGYMYYVVTETYQSVFLQYTLRTRKVS